LKEAEINWPSTRAVTCTVALATTVPIVCSETVTVLRMAWLTTTGAGGTFGAGVGMNQSTRAQTTRSAAAIASSPAIKRQRGVARCQRSGKSATAAGTVCSVCGMRMFIEICASAESAGGAPRNTS
jgi:hypothetical protein